MQMKHLQNIYLAQIDLLTHRSIYVDLNMCMAYIIVIFERGVCLLFFSR